jgi:hypothetical protein
MFLIANMQCILEILWYEEISMHRELVFSLGHLC